jgi:NADH:ubiquinone oxidoreductase subunit C
MHRDKGLITFSDNGHKNKKIVYWECSPLQFLAIASRLKESQARLITIYATPEPAREVKLHYYFEMEGLSCILKTATDKLSIGSLYTLFVNADFIEREINNIFKIKFLGHPNLPRFGSGEE